jgi:hypothetical protein
MAELSKTQFSLLVYLYCYIEVDWPYNVDSDMRRLVDVGLVKVLVLPLYDHAELEHTYEHAYLRAHITADGRHVVERVDPLVVISELSRHVHSDFRDTRYYDTFVAWIEKLSIAQLPELLVSESRITRAAAKRRLEELKEWRVSEQMLFLQEPWRSRKDAGTS